MASDKSDRLLAPDYEGLAPQVPRPNVISARPSITRTRPQQRKGTGSAGACPPAQPPDGHLCCRALMVGLHVCLLCSVKVLKCSHLRIEGI